MPKKVHGRPGGRVKNRPRRQPVRAAVPAATPAPPEGDLVEATTPAAATVARPAPAARPVQETVTPPRRGAAARRAPAITFNYSYLRSDIRTLAVLAPSMVVLLVIAFFVFH